MLTLARIEKLKAEAVEACEKHRGDGFAERVVELCDLIMTGPPSESSDVDETSGQVDEMSGQVDEMSEHVDEPETNRRKGRGRR